MRLLILVNRDFVLYNFRVELVEQLIKEKNEVYICLPYGEKVDAMTAMGCRFIPVAIDKRGKNPFHDVRLLRSYQKIFAQVRPDVILTYTTKVNIYAGILAGRRKIPYLMNISGLGTAVEYKSIMQRFMICLYRMAAKHAACLFFQNEENLAFFREHHIYKGKYKKIPGSGVNIERWKRQDYPDDAEQVEFLFIARVIREKGIEEYLAAAEQIRKEYPKTVFHVIGPCDGAYEEILDRYEREGVIRYHGMVADTGIYLKHAHCTVHPSYYPEGISNVLLESAASGRPVITTDRSGCRETVEHGVTGFVFEQKNREQLIDCIRTFLNLSNEKRCEMGLAGRAKMEREFDRRIVVNAYMEEIKAYEAELSPCRIQESEP